MREFIFVLALTALIREGYSNKKTAPNCPDQIKKNDLNLSDKIPG